MNADSTQGAALAQVRHLISTLRGEYNAEYRAVLYTAAGRIVCDLAPPAALGDLVSFTDDPTTLTLDISAAFDGQALFDTKLINIKNAVLYNDSSQEELSRAEQMILFTDQIIGFGLQRRNA